jgi:hypothetical protein
MFFARLSASGAASVQPESDEELRRQLARAVCSYLPLSADGVCDLQEAVAVAAAGRLLTFHRN